MRPPPPLRRWSARNFAHCRRVRAFLRRRSHCPAQQQVARAAPPPAPLLPRTLRRRHARRRPPRPRAADFSRRNHVSTPSRRARAPRAGHPEDDPRELQVVRQRGDDRPVRLEHVGASSGRTARWQVERLRRADLRLRLQREEAAPGEGDRPDPQLDGVPQPAAHARLGVLRRVCVDLPGGGSRVVEGSQLEVARIVKKDNRRRGRRRSSSTARRRRRRRWSPRSRRRGSTSTTTASSSCRARSRPSR